MEEPILEMFEGPVWVLVIEHRHGFNHYVNKTQDGMLDTLANYCDEWWDELDEDDKEGEILTDRQEKIDYYFDHIYEEWYTVDTAYIGP